MRTEFDRVRATVIAGLVLLLLLFAAPAGAQSAGVRAGVSVDPEQFYFGGHVETSPLADRVRFRPNIEIGIGDDTTIAAFNFEFAYFFPSSEPWSVYAGAGPALNIVDRPRGTDAEPGFNVVVGVAHEDGLFGEFKIGGFDSPRLKFGIGYAFRWR